VHRESPPQPVSRLRTEGGGERFLPMGVEIIQHQMNGVRRGVTLRDPCRIRRATPAARVQRRAFFHAHEYEVLASV
jgi:hypothetical protein